MGMNISSSSAQSIYQMPYNAARAQRHQQFDALAQALQSGDATAANKAYAALVPSGTTVNPDSPLGKIGAALQAGNLTAAQADLPPRFQNTGSGASASQFALNDPAAASTADGSSATGAADSTQSGSSGAAQVGHHHHHHHGGGGGAMDALFGNTSSATGSSSTSTAASSDSSQGNADLTTASFLKARAAMANLVSDLQSMASSQASSTSPTVGASTSASATSTGASNLLSNPDFQNLESAFNSGNASTVNTAWAQFIANTFGGSNSAATQSAASSTASAVA